MKVEAVYVNIAGYGTAFKNAEADLRRLRARPAKRGQLKTTVTIAEKWAFLLFKIHMIILPNNHLTYYAAFLMQQRM